MLALIPRLLPGLIATTNTKQHRSTTKQPVRSFRFEMLEAREVLSHTHMAPADPPATESESEAQSTAFAEQIAAAMNASLQAQAQLRAPMPVVIDEVQLNATGDEIAIQGSLAGRSFETTTTITGLFTPSSDPGVCGILNLELGPIHLDILGLNLDTSEICLNITAQEGSGNLLGNLLCEVADLLSGPTSLSDLLSGGLIPADQLSGKCCRHPWETCSPQYPRPASRPMRAHLVCVRFWICPWDPCIWTCWA